MSKKTKNLTLLALLVAIEALFCFTVLGSIPVGPSIVATLAAIPVIVAALAIDTKTGTILGAIAGLFSFIVWVFMPPNPFLAFAFNPFAPGGNLFSVLICFVPRILVGLVAGLMFKWLDKTRLPKVLTYSISAIVGSAMNTLGVLFGIYFCFYDTVTAGMQAMGAVGGNLAMAFVTGSILTNGIPEAIVAAVVAFAVAYPLRRYAKNN